MILSVITRNNSGVIARVAGLFSRRGFSLTSLAGEATHDSDISRLTIAVTEDEESLLQIQRQLEKLEDIQEVRILNPEGDVIRELALIKVENSPQLNKKIQLLTQQFEVSIIDLSCDNVMFQMCSSEAKIDEFIEELRPFGLCECVRTGVIALESLN